MMPILKVGKIRGRLKCSSPSVSKRNEMEKCIRCEKLQRITLVLLTLSNRTETENVSSFISSMVAVCPL